MDLLYRFHHLLHLILALFHHSRYFLGLFRGLQGVFLALFHLLRHGCCRCDQLLHCCRLRAASLCQLLSRICQIAGTGSNGLGTCTDIFHDIIHRT